ncbi:MAG: hypothetical protein GEV05_23215 [Betaproteobacteria bacterium]|nr:hypothetical protein [Betaproteobacteria bacterium]
MLSDKTLLVTGGTGTFGNAVLHRFLKSEFEEVRGFSREEIRQKRMQNLLRDDRVMFRIDHVREAPPCLRS